MTRLENGFILVIEPQVWVSIERIWGYLVLRLIKITKDPILILLFTCHLMVYSTSIAASIAQQQIVANDIPVRGR